MKSTGDSVEKIATRFVESVQLVGRSYMNALLKLRRRLLFPTAVRRASVLPERPVVLQRLESSVSSWTESIQVERERAAALLFLLSFEEIGDGIGGTEAS